MKLSHVTTRQNLASIQGHGLLVSKGDPQAKIKGCWMCTASNLGWAILHTMRKHKAHLEEVIVLEVRIPRRRLTRFRRGLYYTVQDVPARAIGTVTPGEAFGASAST